jgi:vacuolar-type H+-ATPase subunit I/STV1
MINMQEDEDIKEEFCGACAAIPIALVGVGASMVGATKRGSHRKMKKITLIVGIVMMLISIMLGVYYIFIKKCEDCR